MAPRSLNKVMLIGNLTRDPELRYTPSGSAVCTLGLATNRTWITDTGEKREETEFHRLVAWNKLAELCSQLLFKGRKIYAEGRLQTRQWTGQDGSMKQTTEIVISDMVILDSKQAPNEGAEETTPVSVSAAAPDDTQPVKVVSPTDDDTKISPKPVAKKTKTTTDSQGVDENVNADDIPF